LTNKWVPTSYFKYSNSIAQWQYSSPFFG